MAAVGLRNRALDGSSEKCRELPETALTALHNVRNPCFLNQSASSNRTLAATHHKHGTSGSPWEVRLSLRLATRSGVPGHVEAIKNRYGVHTKTEAVELALRHLAGQPMTREQALAMRGAHAMGEVPADIGPCGAA